MIAREGLDALRTLAPGAVLSIGNFDGIHLGHQEILRLARSLGGRVVIATFEPHPLTVLRPDRAPPRLMSVELKKKLLEDAGVDELIILPPARDLLNVTAPQFWTILRDQAQPAHLVEGETFTFGKNRLGTFDLLRAWSKDSSVRLHEATSVSIPLLDMQIAPVSSTLIRWLLAHGRVRDAAICLGRPYVLEGTVGHGHGRGKSTVMATANLECADQMIPGDGVYAGGCTIDGKSYLCAINIGIAPTFGHGPRQVEAHVLGYSGDLYGRALQLEFLDWVREERKFPTPENLRAQIGRDIRAIESRASAAPRPWAEKRV